MAGVFLWFLVLTAWEICGWLLLFNALLSSKFNLFSVENIFLYLNMFVECSENTFLTKIEVFTF